MSEGKERKVNKKNPNTIHTHTAPITWLVAIQKLTTPHTHTTHLYTYMYMYISNEGQHTIFFLHMKISCIWFSINNNKHTPNSWAVWAPHASARESERERERESSDKTKATSHKAFSLSDRSYLFVCEHKHTQRQKQKQIGKKIHFRYFAAAALNWTKQRQRRRRRPSSLNLLLPLSPSPLPLLSCSRAASVRTQHKKQSVFILIWHHQHWNLIKQEQFESSIRIIWYKFGEIQSK